MTAGIPLRLGPLEAEGFEVQRSGIRWLCPDGHQCRPGEVVAFCNLGLLPKKRLPRRDDPFNAEARDFQVALALRRGGRLRRAVDSSHGGFLDQQHFHQFWTPDFVIGHLEDSTPAPIGEGEDELRLLFLAGRRMTELAELRHGMLTGWHDRSRAWWGEGPGDFGTLLSLGICDQLGVVRGDRFAFLEMFEAVPGPAQAIFVPDDALVPCAVSVTQQFLRTPREFQTIAADFHRSFATGPALPTPEDCIFAGALLSGLRRSPLTEGYDVLTRRGLRRAGPVNAVILSLHAEPPVVLRHRQLGYVVHIHDFRVAETGPAVRTWLRANFEPLKRNADDIYRDYVTLIDTVRARSDVTFLVMNIMSSSALEEIYCYAPFDRPMGETLSMIRNKELNLMLHDLAREHDVAIVDVDAMAAELGGALHLPDGVHQSGNLQVETRREILRILSDRRVPGFARSARASATIPAAAAATAPRVR